MTHRVPNIYLTPRELDQRASQSVDEARRVLFGRKKEQLLKQAKQDRDMAQMKRLVGDHEGAMPGDDGGDCEPGMQRRE